MKEIRLTLAIIVLLACSTVSFAQLSQMLTFSKKCISIRMEKASSGEMERNYYNDDCIDYTLVRNSDALYPLHPGKNTVARLTPSDQFSDPWRMSGQSIKIYPGRFVNMEKLKPVVYAMPVVSGKNVKCTAKDINARMNNDSVRLKAFFFRMNPGDTVCAVRSGIACQDVPNNILYIYHEDGTIAVYNNVVKSVKHTDRIVAGQLIGTVAEGKKSIRLLLLGMERKNLVVKEGLQFPYSCLTPIFRTADGDRYIDEEVKLTAKTDDELVMQELTSKEKKTHPSVPSR